MTTLSRYLIQYAHYHRDPRNIRTHFVGIPMIVVAVACLLAQLPLPLPGGLNAAHLATLVMIGFYFWLDLALGVCMALAMLAALALGLMLAGGPHGLLWGVGLFVLGWVIQFVGHVFEGRKPAFVDDLTGLVIGPLFVVAEWLFACGLFQPLHAEITREAGPVRLRPHAQQSASPSARRHN